MSGFFSSLFGGRSASSAPVSTECSVCLVTINPGDAFTDPSGCGHLLHLQCFVDASSKMHSACPTCRAPFKINAASNAPNVPPIPVAVAIPTMQMQQQQQQQSNFITNSLMQRSYRHTTSSSVAVPPEEPIAVVDRASVAVGSTVACSDAPVIEVTITPEVPSIVAGSDQRMFVNVSTVSQDTVVSAKSRVGVDLVMILDKSGSMSGEKERLLRNAVEFVIGELDEIDRLCTVAFDNRAHFEHGFIRMGEPGKEKALKHARGPGLGASGGTDIYDGLQNGVAALNARKIPNAITTIFLLTDGIDDAHLEEKLALARHARSLGWFMFIFALGADHNATHLNAIAEAADSSYIFIDNLSTVREAFGGAIGSQQGVAGKLLNLSIQAVDAGVVIHRAVAGQYASNVAADGRMAIVTYPNLLIGEKRDCCLEVTIPRAMEGTSLTNLLNATLTYTPAAADSAESKAADVTVAAQTCIVTRPDVIAVPIPRNEIVDSQINRLTGIEVIERATSLADANNLDEARALVSQTQAQFMSSVSVSHPATQAMISELTNCMGRLQTRTEWETVGRAEQVECSNVHKFQRGVYGKKSKYSGCDSSAVMYSNAMSKGGQSKASKF